MNILVSACLLGARCRYDGGSKPNDAVLSLMDRHALIPVCPEQLGGLPTPRPPAERRGDLVVTSDGEDVTRQFARGADEAVRLSKLYNCELAILKSKSPSCGAGLVYDGTFSGELAPGFGVTAEALKRAGVQVVSEEDTLKRLTASSPA